MTDDISPQHTPDAVALWRSLRDFLEVDIEVVGLPDNPEPESEVTVRFTATNVAPSGPDWPQIVFEDVRVEVSMEGSQHSGGTERRLESGSSVKSERSYSYRTLAGIRAEVHGSISRRSFFQFTKPVPLPQAHTRPTVLAYVQAFNHIGIHTVLDSTLSSVSVPAPYVTVANLRATASTLEEGAAQAEGAQSLLQSLPYSSLGQQGRSHVEAAHQYLSNISRRLSDHERLPSVHTDKLGAQVEALTDLELEAAEVNRMTEEMMEAYGILDEDAEYRYKGR